MSKTIPHLSFTRLGPYPARYLDFDRVLTLSTLRIGIMVVTIRRSARPAAAIRHQGDERVSLVATLLVSRQNRCNTMESIVHSCLLVGVVPYQVREFASLLNTDDVKPKVD